MPSTVTIPPQGFAPALTYQLPQTTSLPYEGFHPIQSASLDPYATYAQISTPTHPAPTSGGDLSSQLPVSPGPADLTPDVFPPMTIGPYINPPRLIRSSCLVLPDVPLDFQVDPDFIQHLPIFRGLPDENPYIHMIEFEEVVRAMGPPTHSDFIRAIMIPFSLRDKAKHWYHSCAPSSFSTWDSFAHAFLSRFFSR